VTRELLKRWVKYNEVCPACTVAGMKDITHFETELPHPVERGHWYIDPTDMPNGEGYVLTMVDRMDGYIREVHIWSKEAKVIEMAFKNVTDKLEFKVKSVHVDDGNNLKFNGYIAGVPVEAATAQQHQRFVERYIQEINRRVREIHVTSQFCLLRNTQTNSYIYLNREVKARTGRTTPS
jgi:IS30 family transposase